MASAKSIDKTYALQRVLPDPTIWTYVRAAVVASLVIDTQLMIVFGAAAFGGPPFFLQLALWLIPFATLVVWSSASVLYLCRKFRAAGLLGMLTRLIGDARSSPSGKSGLWDDWLDIPEPHGP
jgi:hypothetical protein